MSRHFRELSVTGALVVVLAVLALLAPGFFQAQPLLSLATREAPTLVVACGMALVIKEGDVGETDVALPGVVGWKRDGVEDVGFGVFAQMT